MRQQIYGYIIDDMIKKIKNGVYKSGEKIPTEKELCKIYGASQSTIKKALKELIQSNYLDSVERVGNYVKTPSWTSYSVNFDYTTLGFMTDSVKHVIDSPKTVKVPDFIDKSKKSTNAIRFDEYFREGDELLCRRALYVYYKRGATPKADWTYEESSQFMEGYSNFCYSSKMIINAVYPDEKQCESLGLEKGVMYYEIKRLDFDEYKKEMGCSLSYIKHTHMILEAYS